MMGRVGLAFKVLFNGAFAKQVAEFGSAAAITESKPAPKPKDVKPPKPVRNDAVTLLATLQREARLLDFFQEPISDYEDAQIGAAVRDVHRQTGEVLERMFAIRPLLDGAENSDVEIPANADAASYKLTGNIGEQRPGNGTLMHHGWRATKCELPQWTGSDASKLVIAPAEVEVKAS
jgi:hypothetical protein